jgi:predicted RNA binding protein YcfA (HicA-like mRNA interferase family)
MTYRQVIKLIENDGWRHVRTTGSHLHYAHGTKQGVVTVAGGGKLSKEVPPGTLNNILKQAGLK